MSIVIWDYLPFTRCHFATRSNGANCLKHYHTKRLDDGLFPAQLFGHVGPENITMGCPNLVRKDSSSDVTCIRSGRRHHGYVLRAHMNKCTLLSNVMREKVVFLYEKF